VDDTLIAAGGSVRVNGVVNGDLLAFGQSVEVRGTVKGDLLTWAQRTTVRGTVEGRIYDFSQSLDLEGQLDHGLYAMTQSLRVDKGAHVGDNIMAFTGETSVEGDVKRSVLLFTAGAAVSGSIGRDLNFTGRDLMLAGTARVGGKLYARVHQLQNVHIAEGALIAGSRDIQERPRANPLTRVGFYFRQALWLVAAMLVGWLGLALFPGFVQGSTQAVGSGWRSLGLGIGVLAGVPVAIIVAAITLVGLPIALMLGAVYVAALYLAKIWVGAYLGWLLLKPAGSTMREWLLGLLLGLVILTAAGFIPYLGGLVHFGVVCLGLGAFAWELYRVSRPPDNRVIA
jgi:cytoskeletal protein CcmA (bactofilin family)